MIRHRPYVYGLRMVESYLVSLEFNREGDHLAAVATRSANQNLSRVLYPDDSTWNGLELRLRQEYFLVSASLQDILRRHLRTWYIG